MASYSNGTQKSLGKVVVANFNSNSGLTQIGDAAWTASGKSGAARLERQVQQVLEPFELVRESART